MSSGSGYAIVPDLTGRTITGGVVDALRGKYSVGNVGYDPTSDQPEGQIIRQEPAVDTRLSELEAVDIWISGNETQQIEMPSLVGKSTDTVIKMLNSSGFEKVWIRLVQPKEGEAEETVQRNSGGEYERRQNTLVDFGLTAESPAITAPYRGESGYTG